MCDINGPDRRFKNQPELGNELTEFDTTLWLTAIEKVTAHPDGMLTFHFYSGMQIDVFPQEGTR